MKTIRYILAIVCALFYTSLNAQTYHKLLDSTETSWYIFSAFIPVKIIGGNQAPASNFYPQSGKCTAKSDTVINSLHYKKFYHEYYYPGMPVNQKLGFIREDTITQKVYFLENDFTTENLLYNFALNVGDTVNLKFPDTFGTYPQGTYTVTAINMVNTVQGLRKQLCLNGTAQDTLKYIESIGSIIHPLYLYNSYYNPGMFAWGGGPCTFPYDLGLACKYSNTIKYYQSCTYTLAQMNACFYKYDSCNYFMNCSGVEELKSNTAKLNLSPNPAKEHINLSFSHNHNDKAIIEVYDVTGKLVKTQTENTITAGDNSINLKLSELQRGFYFIRIKGATLLSEAAFIISE